MASSFLKTLARARPDPGGGAAAAHGAALGMALLEKIVRLEQTRPASKGNPGNPWDGLLRRVRRVADALRRLQDEDVRAYRQFTYARNQGDPQALAAALEETVSCPLRIMQQSQEGLCLLARTGARCRLHLVADLLVAVELLGAAFRGAFHIAQANLPLMDHDGRRAVWDADLTHTLGTLEVELQQVRKDLMERESCP